MSHEQFTGGLVAVPYQKLLDAEPLLFQHTFDRRALCDVSLRAYLAATGSQCRVQVGHLEIDASEARCLAVKTDVNGSFTPFGGPQHSQQIIRLTRPRGGWRRPFVQRRADIEQMRGRCRAGWVCQLNQPCGGKLST